MRVLRLYWLGLEIVDGLERDSEWEWVHAWAPDGSLDELASRIEPPARRDGAT